MSKIAIVTQLHPCTNPRPVKEANCLAEAGHEVFFVTVLQTVELTDRDRESLDERVTLITAVDLRTTNRNSLTKFLVRLGRKVGQKLMTVFGIETRFAVCHAPGRLLQACIDLRCDLYIGHIEAGLWVGRELSERGYTVAFDIEDWHSRDGLPVAQKQFPQQLVASLERFAVKNGAYATTTSVPLADALAEAYDSNPPTVIRNVFPQSETDNIDGQSVDRTDPQTPSLIWFSQTIGRGRGLEELWDALQQIATPLQIHIRGNRRADFVSELESALPHQHTLFIHSQVSHAQLLSRIAEHDIGLAIERSDPPSRDLTLTNKIFQYLQAGCCVIATKTAGQTHLGTQHKEAILLADNTPEAIAEAINSLVSSPEELQNRKSAARSLADSQLNWDQESEQFLNLVNKVLAK